MIIRRASASDGYYTQTGDALTFAGRKRKSCDCAVGVEKVRAGSTCCDEYDGRDGKDAAAADEHANDEQQRSFSMRAIHSMRAYEGSKNV